MTQIDPSPGGFTIAGRTYEIGALNQVLYKKWYATKSGFQEQESLSDPSPLYEQERQAFTGLLTACNQSEEKKHTGWTVRECLPAGQVLVTSKGTTKTLNIGQYEFPEAGRLAPGHVIEYKNRKENRHIQQGFYYVFSTAAFEYIPTVVRYYWNIDASAVGTLIGIITQKLNRYGLPFLFKCADHPALYYRRDCCVLYINKQYTHLLHQLLEEINQVIPKTPHTDVPLFTCRVSDGVGYAESPLIADSFGIDRIRMVSAALIGAFDRHLDSADERMEAVYHQFRLNHIDLEKPYLNPNPYRNKQ